MDSTNLQSSANQYYTKINRQFLALLWLHFPLAILTAYLAGQSYTVAIAFSLAILSLPTLLTLRNSESLGASIANAVALVNFSALLIDVSGGMTELHFHIFASLGVMIMLAQPLAVLAALLFVVVHHVGFFFFMPLALINYQASFGILVIHALFALAIGVPAILISQKFRLYIVGVKEIVDEIQGISGDLARAAEQMLNNSQALTQSTQQEAVAMQRTAASLEQLTAMISRNTDSADVAAKTSADSKSRSNHGVRVVGQVVDSLGQISGNNSEIVGAIERSNQSMSQIIGMINEIASKTAVINDIVFQTKLLSFNASVEAARAGEHGKGFSVVAEEIGNLARMSGTSATEIATLLQSSTVRVQQIIDSTRSEIQGRIQTGKSKIEEGIRVADDCRNVLSEIDTNLNTVSQTAGEIAAASKEQATGVGEISGAMQSVSQASQQNQTVSEQAASVANEVDQGSKRLSGAIDKLLSAVSNKAA